MSPIYLSDTLSGTPSCTIRAPLGSSCKHHGCGQHNYRVENTGMYLFVSNKDHIGCDRQLVCLHYPVSLLPCASAGNRTHQGGAALIPPLFCPPGISRRSICLQEQLALRGAMELLRHQKPFWRTHLWVLCPATTAGREVAAAVPLSRGMDAVSPFSCYSSAEVSEESTLNMVLWFSLTLFYLISWFTNLLMKWKWVWQIGNGALEVISWRICNILNPNDIWKWVKSSSKRENEKKTSAWLKLCSNFQNI